MITEDNVRALVQQAGGPSESRFLSQFMAQRLVDVLSKHDQLIVLERGTIDNMERAWVGTRYPIKARSRKSSSSSQFLFLAEYTTFLDHAHAKDPWKIIRQLTYFAISEKALKILLGYTDDKDDSLSLPYSIPFIKNRPCKESVVSSALKCLQGGNVDQVFMAALKCTALSLYSITLGDLEDSIAGFLPTNTWFLGYGALRRTRLSNIVNEVHDLTSRETPVIDPRSRHTSSSHQRIFERNGLRVLGNLVTEA